MEIPKWAYGENAKKVKPPKSIQENGWSAEDAPSAEVFNWWMHHISQAMDELQAKCQSKLADHNERISAFEEETPLRQREYEKKYSKARRYTDASFDRLAKHVTACKRIILNKHPDTLRQYLEDTDHPSLKN